MRRTGDAKDDLRGPDDERLRPAGQRAVVLAVRLEEVADAGAHPHLQRDDSLGEVARSALGLAQEQGGQRAGEERSISPADTLGGTGRA